jgi:hypothetical protein
MTDLNLRRSSARNDHLGRRRDQPLGNGGPIASRGPRASFTPHRKQRAEVTKMAKRWPSWPSCSRPPVPYPSSSPVVPSTSERLHTRRSDTRRSRPAWFSSPFLAAIAIPSANFAASPGSQERRGSLAAERTGGPQDGGKSGRESLKVRYNAKRNPGDRERGQRHLFQ